MNSIPAGFSLLACDLDHVLEHAQASVLPLRDARIFLTGGTGFFGKWLVESLAWANDRCGLKLSLTVLSRNPASFYAHMPHLSARADIACIQGELGHALPKGLGSFTHIIHAANLPFDQQPFFAARHTQAMLRGTDAVLHLAQPHASFLFTSSGAAYTEATPPPSACVEPLKTLTEPAQVYGQTKRMLELMCIAESEQHDFKACIARCFSFIGPYLPPGLAAYDLIHAACANAPLCIRGDGQARRSYLYGADLAVWLLTLLTHGAQAHIYNVGGDHAVSIYELAATIARHTGNPPITVLGQQAPGTAPEQYIPDVCKAGELGLRAAIDLDEAIRRTLLWETLRKG